MKLRSHLYLLALCTLFPLIAFAIIVSLLFADREQETFERGAKQRTRALLTAVDAELKSSIAALRALAASRNLARDDLRAFHDEAGSALRSQPDWATITLVSAQGEPLVDALVPHAGVLRPLTDMESFQRFARSGTSAVGNLLTRERDRFDFPVRVAVTRNGRLTYVLSAIVKPAAIDALLASQRLPADWIGVVVDGKGRIVSRTVDPARSVGKLASESIRSALSRPDEEGWFYGTTIEGTAVYTPYSRSTVSGWTVAMGIPVAAVVGGARRTLWLLAAGILAAAALAALLAFAFGRRIARPITSLAGTARAIADGQVSRAQPHATVDEVRELSEALSAAAAAVHERAESQGRLAAIVGATNDAVFGLGPDGRIGNSNPAVTTLFGYETGELEGRPFATLIAADHVGDLEDHLARVSQGTGVRAECVCVHKQGRRIDVSLSLAPILDRNGTIHGIAAVVHDITDTKRAEAALRSADKAKDEFLAMLGHELRNPLSAISGAVAVLNTTNRAPEIAERAVAIVGRQVQHLARLVDDLLDVSRVTMGKVMLDQHPFDLAELARRLMGTLRSGGRLELHAVTLDAISVWVQADETRVEQVLTNLMGNALKYTPAGGRIAVRVGPDGDVAVLEVADSGAGIAPDLVEKIFELFAQGERTLERGLGGLGVGLTVSRKLVEMHGGTLAVASRGEGQGAVFTARFPAIEPPLRTEIRIAPLVAATHPRRILIIEDNDDARAMLSAALSSRGHEVHAAADGISGLRIAQSVQPEIALIDIGLPGIDGYEVARRLRAAHADETILLIAVTGYGQAEDRHRAFDAGFHAHLTKPVGMEDLTRVMTETPVGS
jgi:PAS domain S-box-containing protein